MKRLKIIIPQQKRYILSILWDKFPHWSCNMMEDEKPVVFTAVLEPGVDYAGDLAWLTRIGLEYFDEKMEREKVISAFFKGIRVDGMTVTDVQFPEDQQGNFRVVVAMHNVRMTIQFPDDWTIPTIV